MRIFSIILLSFFVCCYGYPKFLRDIFGSALMGDWLSSLPSRFHCVGAGKNFTHFQLFSRIHPDEPKPLQPDNAELLYNSDYDPSNPTVFILHGFVDNLHMTDWMQRTKTKLLSVGEYNVIIVDWSCGNGFPYAQAVRNSKDTAGETTKLINFLQERTGAKPADFHLIGHSLGGHIAALVGHSIPHLGRISALDPAGPRFYDAPLEERLDPTDAQFVDAIHTDAGRSLHEGLGMTAQGGHVDFYPNGGKDQPGCHSSPLTILPQIGMQRMIRYYTTCDHVRSADLYIDSIRAQRDETGCQPVGVACSDWETFGQGRCADCSHPGACATMGFRSNFYREARPHSTQYEYYLKTSEDDPYCLYQYQVIVETGCETGLCGDPEVLKTASDLGAMRLELKTQGGKLMRLNMDEETKTEMKPGGQYVYLATSRYPMDSLQTAKVWWGSNSKPGHYASPRAASSDISLKKIEIIPIELPEKMRKFSIAPVIVLCGPSDKTIVKDQYLELTINSC